MKIFSNKKNENVVVNLNISILKSNPLIKNMDEETFGYLYASIEQIGIINPIIVDKENNILDGHRRMKASKQLQNKTIPCLVVDDINDVQKLQVEIATHLAQRNLTYLSKIILYHTEFLFYDKEENNGNPFPKHMVESLGASLKLAQEQTKDGKDFYALPTEFKKILIEIDKHNKITKLNIRVVLAWQDDKREIFFNLFDSLDLSTIDKKILHHQINTYFNIDDTNEYNSSLNKDFKLDFKNEIIMIESLLLSA